MFPNGTLLVSDLNEVLDTGQYSCQAKSLASDHFALRHVQVSIKVPPVVEPLALAKSLHRGQRYNIMCTVTRGDLPVSIRWFKDGRSVAEQLGLGLGGGGGSGSGPASSQSLIDVTGGDQSIDPSTGSGGLAIKQLDPYSSTLTFASLQSYHRGEYTCEATNEVGRANQSSSLVVHGECYWRESARARMQTFEHARAAAATTSENKFPPLIRFTHRGQNLI